MAKTQPTFVDLSVTSPPFPVGQMTLTLYDQVLRYCPQLVSVVPVCRSDTRSRVGGCHTFDWWCRATLTYGADYRGAGNYGQGDCL